MIVGWLEAFLTLLLCLSICLYTSYFHILCLSLSLCVSVNRSELEKRKRKEEIGV